MDPVDERWVECQALIDTLLDPAARWDERDDAAMDLADADDAEALDALLQVGHDADENETLLETVGESIAEILSRHPERASEKLHDLAPAARRAYEGRSASG